MLSSYTQIGKNHLHFANIDSTNDYASVLLSKSNPIDGTVISAGYQSNGHGQFDRKWASLPNENLLLSVILYPNFIRAEHQFYLSISIALGILDYLKNYNVNSKIKWPNDIYVDNYKISGILIKNAIQGSNLSHSIVGIGINLNQMTFDENLPNPSSLSMLTGRHFDTSQELIKLNDALSQRYNELKSLPLLHLKKEYEQFLYQKHETITLFKDGKEEKAIIRGISDGGKLEVELENGLIMSLLHGEVQIKYQV